MCISNRPPFLDLSVANPSPSATQSPPSAGMALHVLQRGDPGRDALEACIQTRYARCFGAQIREWFPHLASLQAEGEILAVAGYRGAGETLYLERYLPATIERCLSGIEAAGARPAGRETIARETVARETIVEIGQLVAPRPGAGRLMIRRLVNHLADEGFQWIATTATRELRLLFSRLGLSPHILCPASADALDPPSRQAWGSYYAHDPLVLVERLETVAAALNAK